MAVQQARKISVQAFRINTVCSNMSNTDNFVSISLSVKFSDLKYQSQFLVHNLFSLNFYLLHEWTLLIYSLRSSGWLIMHGWTMSSLKTAQHLFKTSLNDLFLHFSSLARCLLAHRRHSINVHQNKHTMNERLTIPTYMIHSFPISFIFPRLIYNECMRQQQ